jgi:hypothetical protein
MDVQPITYRGRIVAACTAECFLLADELAYRAPGDPELVFVVAMCSYANDMPEACSPAPFNDTDARRYARAFLIPGELLERSELDVDRTAVALGVPAEELRAARAEHEWLARRPTRRGDRPMRRRRRPGPRRESAASTSGASYRGGQSSLTLSWQRARSARNEFLPRTIQRFTAV